MTPNLSIRIDSIISSLEDVIVPAIDPASGIALEQAGMILAHLKMAVDQLPHVRRFERLCLDDIQHTATTVIEQCLLLDVKLACVAKLERTLSDSDSTDEDQFRAISALLEALVHEAQAVSADCLSKDTVFCVLEFSERQANRERAWFAQTGFDPKKDQLPSVADVASGHV